MTQKSAGHGNAIAAGTPATPPFSAIISMALLSLASVSDQEATQAVETILERLLQHLNARIACLFLLKQNASAVLLMQKSTGTINEPDVTRHRLAVVEQPLPEGGVSPLLKTISTSAPGSSAKLVLSYEMADGNALPSIDEAALVSVLTGMAGALRRGHLQGAASLKNRNEVANALDQGIAVYGVDGSLRFVNSIQQAFFSDYPNALETFSNCLQCLKSWTSDARLNTLSYSDVVSFGVEATAIQPKGSILKVQIRPLHSGATMVICTDIGEIHSEKARWRAAIDGAGVGTWEWSVADGANRINERWAEMLGYTRKELEPLTIDAFRSLLTPESVIANRIAASKLFNRESDRFECEMEMYHKNGHRIWVLSRGRVTTFDDDGHPAIISGMHLEISELKLAEERLKQVVEGAQLGTWDWDIGENVQRANHQWATMLGYTEEEVSPMTYERWRALVHPDDIDNVEEMMSLCLSGQANAMAAEYRMRHKNGEWRWLIDRAKVISKTREGNAAFIVGVQIEIGEQKAREEALLAAKTQAEQALLQRNHAERRLADIAAVSEDWFWEQDSNLRFQFLSHTQFLRNAKGAKAQLLGRSWQEWLQDCPDQQSGANWEALFQTLADRAPFRDFVMELASDNEAEPSWLRFSGTPVFDEKGGFVGYRGVGSDVTQLYLAKLRAEEASKSKSMFLANMSHEIRTPLNGVLGMAEVLDASVTEPRQKEMIKTIRDSGESLLNILNDILDMSKIEAKKLELELVPFDPTELATRIEDLYRMRAEEKGLDFEISLGVGAERPRIGDPHRLRQILNNLISNAIKFTERGRVSVVVRGKPGRPLIIEISDTGIGMSPAQLEHIHEEFVQADSSITRRYGGTGLGMSITRTLVDMMGGRISIASEVGVGTRISVELPLPISDAAPIVAEPPSFKPPAAAGLHFLIADDNVTNCTVLRHLLRQYGAKTTVVSNGLDALNAWKETPFDLLLLDIAMPMMDGITAIEKIRSEEQATGRRYTSAIAVTANVMPFQIADYLAAGFDATVGKPVSSKQLAQTVSALLEQT